MRPRKITLGQCAAQGDYKITFYCEGSPSNVYCRHRGEMLLCDALALFGATFRLDQVPARCSACDGHNIDARSRPRHRQGGAGVGPFDPSD